MATLSEMLDQKNPGRAEEFLETYRSHKQILTKSGKIHGSMAAQYELFCDPRSSWSGLGWYLPPEPIKRQCHHKDCPNKVVYWFEWPDGKGEADVCEEHSERLLKIASDMKKTNFTLWGYPQ